MVLDQPLRRFVCFEEIQRRDEETERREQANRRMEREARRREEDSVREEYQRLEARERETRRTRIETRYRIAIIRHQLEPNNFHRQQLADILALLQEYQDTL